MQYVKFYLNLLSWVKLKLSVGKLSNLVNSLIEFSVFMSIVEAGGMEPLSKGATLEELQQATTIPLEILTQQLNALQKMDIIRKNNHKFSLTSPYATIYSDLGDIFLRDFLRVKQGEMNDFITASRMRHLEARWGLHNENLVNGYGTISATFVTIVEAISEEVHKALSLENALFLDVGAGVCGIGLSLCERHPTIKIVALEPAEQPFQIAQKKIKESPYGSRITLRSDSVENLSETELYDIAYMAQPFIPEDVFEKGLLNVYRALKPGGILITYSFVSISPFPLNNALSKLESSLEAGATRTVNELIDKLKKLHFKPIFRLPELIHVTGIIAIKE